MAAGRRVHNLGQLVRFDETCEGKAYHFQRRLSARSGRQRSSQLRRASGQMGRLAGLPIDLCFNALQELVNS
jgi:hypothetical protein